MIATTSPRSEATLLFLRRLLTCTAWHLLSGARAGVKRQIMQVLADEDLLLNSSKTISKDIKASGTADTQMPGQITGTAPPWTSLTYLPPVRRPAVRSARRWCPVWRIQGLPSGQTSAPT